jgi:starvation-inducible DNA-binding protein
MRETFMKIEIGLSTEQRQELAKGLSILLADSYTLYIKTQNFHWNVVGPHFNSLHAMFERHYLELANAVDEIAERIRALGHRAPGSYGEFSELTTLKEERGAPPAEEMIKQLTHGHEQVVATARKILPVADTANDQPTVDLLTRRMEEHEKTAWMLRSLIEK